MTPQQMVDQARARVDIAAAKARVAARRRYDRDLAVLVAAGVASWDGSLTKTVASWEWAAKHGMVDRMLDVLEYSRPARVAAYLARGRKPATQPARQRLRGSWVLVDSFGEPVGGTR